MILNIPLQQLLQEISDLIISSDADDAGNIARIASLEHATPQDIAIVLGRGDTSVFDETDITAIQKCNAGLILTEKVPVPGKKYLIVRDALEAFNKLVALGEKIALEIPKQINIDPTALVDKNAFINAGAVIGKHTRIYAGAFIGHDCIIGNHVLIYPGTIILDHCTIGDHSIIHAGTVIGSDGFGYQVSQAGMRKIPQIGIVRVGKYVEIGANCSIDRAAFDETIIGNGVKIDNGVHIAHNVIIGDHTAILAQTGIAGSTKIGMGCMIGGQVAIKDHLVIGDGVKIVSKSGVLSNISNGQTVAGLPAVPFSQWKRTMVVINKLPEYAKLIQEMQKKQGAWSGIKRFFGGK